MKPLRLFSTLALSAVIVLCAATAWKLRTAENAAPANRAWGNVETRQTSASPLKPPDELLHSIKKKVNPSKPANF